MEVSEAHLRYLLAIYDLMKEKSDVRVVDMAKRLNVSKPSVTKMLGILMEKGFLVKEPYSKIRLTDAGLLLAQDHARCVYALKGRMGCMGLTLTENETWEAACLLAAALPERVRLELINSKGY